MTWYRSVAEIGPGQNCRGAEHEVSKNGSKKPRIAFALGLARRNRYCSSMEYEMSNGGTIIGTVARRDIAESIRSIPEAGNSSDHTRASFRAYMNPPDIDPFAKDES